jgi:hypothetical protein
MGFIFYEFVPALSQTRSVHVRAAALQHRHATSPVLYFGRRAYSASFHLDESKYRHLTSDKLAEASEFLLRHREVILVASPECIEKIRVELGDRIEISTADTRGHLYLSHSRPHPARRIIAILPTELR